MRAVNTAPRPPADWTREQLLRALHNAGWSLRRLALHHQVNPSTLQKVIYTPYPRGELRIAEALGVRPWEIWPSRYDANGKPNRHMGRPAFLPRVIPPSGRVNRSTRGGAVNVKRAKAV